MTCFASNLARVESIALAAVAAGRHPVLSGRALQRMVEAAQECGYLLDFPPCIAEQQAGYLPRDKVLFICTGSQGEPRASMAKLANGEHRDLVLEQGDTAIFSSRVIPGNERSVGRLHNALMARGVEVITDHDADIHVSGHPARDELVRVYQWVRPRIALPVHGEVRHMIEHAALARACQVPETIVAPNGTLVRLAPGPAEIIDHVPCRPAGARRRRRGADRRSVAARAAQASVERRGGGHPGDRQPGQGRGGAPGVACAASTTRTAS